MMDAMRKSYSYRFMAKLFSAAVSTYLQDTIHSSSKHTIVKVAHYCLSTMLKLPNNNGVKDSILHK